MTEFSKNEEELLKSIPNSDLRMSLYELRKASGRIWAGGEAPRIIRDYTDHGVLHSERIVERAVGLLKANRGKKLSQEEMYLLLAGIYLHDIGMQCDVVRHPQIKAQTEELGAKFDIVFTAQRSSSYSIEEQKAIRKNHHYLSIAWIAYAKRTGETVLGRAAQSIPNDLVDDLMEVCKHHTSLPIESCRSECEYDGLGRRRLVAALLRFADELDIAANRVSIETVQTFTLDPSNAVYWWLHNRTKITCPSLYLVKVEVLLNSNDIAQYGQIIQSAFLDKFRHKNEPVLTILAHDSIPVRIHAQSKVKEANWEDPLPPEIREALQALSGQQGNSSTPVNTGAKSMYEPQDDADGGPNALPSPAPPGGAEPVDRVERDPSVAAMQETDPTVRTLTYLYDMLDANELLDRSQHENAQADVDAAQRFAEELCSRLNALPSARPQTDQKPEDLDAKLSSALEQIAPLKSYLSRLLVLSNTLPSPEPSFAAYQAHFATIDANRRELLQRVKVLAEDLADISRRAQVLLST